MATRGRPGMGQAMGSGLAVGDETLERADGDGLVHGAAAAGVLAGTHADAADGGRHGAAPAHGLGRALDLVDAQLLHVGRDVHAGRAGGHARRDDRAGVGGARDGLAGGDRGLEGLAVVLERLEHRVPAGAAEVATRRLRDVLGELVRALQTLLRALALADLLEDVADLVHADAAREALAATLLHGLAGVLAGEVDDVDGVVPHRHAAPAHDGTERALELVGQERWVGGPGTRHCDGGVGHAASSAPDGHWLGDCLPPSGRVEGPDWTLLPRRPAGRRSQTMIRSSAPGHNRAPVAARWRAEACACGPRTPA